MQLKKIPKVHFSDDFSWELISTQTIKKKDQQGQYILRRNIVDKKLMVAVRGSIENVFTDI